MLKGGEEMKKIIMITLLGLLSFSLLAQSDNLKGRKRQWSVEYNDPSLFFIHDCVGEMSTAEIFPYALFKVKQFHENNDRALVKPYVLEKKEIMVIEELPGNFCVSLNRSEVDDGYGHGNYYYLDHKENDIRFLIRNLKLEKGTYTVEVKFVYEKYVYNTKKDCFKGPDKKFKPSKEDLAEQCYIKEENIEVNFTKKFTLKEKSKELYFEKKYWSIFGKETVWWSKGRFYFVIKDSKNDEMYSIERGFSATW